MDSSPELKRKLGIAVLWVAGLNFAYFGVEFTMALKLGSVSLLADSIDLLEDVAINILNFLALGWSLHARAVTGKMLAFLICIPALFAAGEAIRKVINPDAPDPLLLALTAGGAGIVNLACALILVPFRKTQSSMARVAYLSARNDVIVNILIILIGFVTALTRSGWPDIILGVTIIAINVFAAKEVWQIAHLEHLEARALTGKLDEEDLLD